VQARFFADGIGYCETRHYLRTFLVTRTCVLSEYIGQVLCNGRPFLIIVLVRIF